MTLQKEIELIEKSYKKSPSDLSILKKLVDKYNLNSNYVKAEKVIKSFQKNNQKKIKLDKKINPELLLLLAITYKYQNENEKATFHFLKAHDAFINAKNKEGLINYGGELIEFYRRQAKYEMAEKTYYKYLFLAKKYKVVNPRLLNKLYNRYAAVLNETSRGRQSIKLSLKAIDEAEKINDNNLMAISYNEMGFSCKNLRKIKESTENYQKAEDIWMKSGYLRDAIQAKMNRVTMLTHNNLITPKEQIRSSLEVVELIDKYKVDYPKITAYEILRSTSVNIYKDYKTGFKYEALLTGERLKEYERSSKAQVANIQEKYQNDKLAKANEEIKKNVKLEKEKLDSARLQLILIIIVLLVVIIALVGFLYLWNKLRKANKLLVKRNEQKTLLVQEIHHRVKNNMQFVKSMLEMQIGIEDSESSSKSLEDVYRRIDAMSLVHEMLFIDEANMNLSIKDYLEKLIDFSTILYNKEKKISFNLNCVNVELPIDQIVSIGIICSELLTNSIKYAFVDQERPKISFDLTQNEDTYSISYSDNGIGMTEKEDNTRKTLGMRLIDIFSRQLNGEYSIQSTNGFNFKLNFKK
jgi:two-component sensor histidine kinase